MVVPTRGPMSQTCPVCSARPGEKCCAPSGRTAPTHSGRWPTTRHGATQPESERRARLVALRLRPDTIVTLDGVAERWGLTRSATVERLATEAVGRK